MKKMSIVMGIFIAISAVIFADFTTGNQLFMKKKYEQARDVFMQTPNDFQCQYGIAVTSQFLGDFQTAIEYYQKVLASKPNFYNGLLGLGYCYQMTGDITDAILTTHKALSVKSTEQGYITLIQLYVIESDFSDAQMTLKKGLQVYPDSQLLQALSQQITRQFQLQTISGAALESSGSAVLDSTAESIVSGTSVGGFSSGNSVSGSDP